MKVLVLGHSSIASRRVLPALSRLDSVETVDLASRRPLSSEDLPGEKHGRLFDGYARAIAESEAGLVYVSLVNSLHAEWAEKALRSGRHVVVDKPAFPTLEVTERLAEEAGKAGLCLAEAIVFTDHPQIEVATEALGGAATRVSAMFSVPPFAADKFRNFPELGGGALYDLGPYAATTSRLFFGHPPETVACSVLSRHPETGVDTAFAVMTADGGGRSMSGLFGFDTEYQNWLTALGPEAAVNFERAYTIPPDMENTVAVSRKNVRETMTPPAGDSFELFFGRLLAAIEANRWNDFTAALLDDARLLARMRRQAGED
jgi:predicted dehydrogenase